MRLNIYSYNLYSQVKSTVKRWSELCINEKIMYIITAYTRQDCNNSFLLLNAIHKIPSTGLDSYHNISFPNCLQGDYKHCQSVKGQIQPQK